MGNSKCSYGSVTRQMVDDLKVGIGDIKAEISAFKIELSDFKGDISNKMTELYNHQSNRLPLWATSLITILGSITTGLIVWSVSHMPKG